MNLATPVIGDNSRRIIGESAPMQAVLRQVTQVAPTKATVLITGETGVGKDVIAQAIHEGSPRKNRPFKAVNCGAFYQDLLQSELFGHEKGAFTGATNQRRGVFEQADGGTLFLDEVAEMSPEVQVKFLRVLETQEFNRLGGERNIKVNVRIIAATNVNLITSVRERKFRQDLYYRLNLFRIQIPPLRDRREDIPLFVSAFIPELSAEHGKPITGITSDALNYLQNADWYGNVRELRNAIETAIISATTEELQLKDFPMDPESQQVSLVPVQT
ncbi:MAG: sigma-54 dependent transcriptional regulator, partial [Candidatus Poribacteria bacterium]|nr:sigma-54 dependent transcriptional regulator [Candidatus Poribacteria bacterium]